MVAKEILFKSTLVKNYKIISVNFQLPSFKPLLSVLSANVL